MKYVIVKENSNIQASLFKVDGYKTKPKNIIDYGGIKVDQMIIISPTFIDKILKRKTKQKLDIYLKYLMSLLEEDSDGENLNIVLNDVARYKSIIKNNYRVYLEKKYYNLLLKKIEMIEEELAKKIIYTKTEEKEIGKSR